MQNSHQKKLYNQGFLKIKNVLDFKKPPKFENHHPSQHRPDLKLQTTNTTMQAIRMSITDLEKSTKSPIMIAPK